jgi:hypothetical protein
MEKRVAHFARAVIAKGSGVIEVARELGALLYQAPELAWRRIENLSN